MVALESAEGVESAAAVVVGVGWALEEAEAAGEAGSSRLRGSAESTDCERDDRKVAAAAFVFFDAEAVLDTALLLISVAVTRRCAGTRRNGRRTDGSGAARLRDCVSGGGCSAGWDRRGDGVARRCRLRGCKGESTHSSRDAQAKTAPAERTAPQGRRAAAGRLGRTRRGRRRAGSQAGATPNVEHGISRSVPAGSC